IDQNNETWVPFTSLAHNYLNAIGISHVEDICTSSTSLTHNHYINFNLPLSIANDMLNDNELENANDMLNDCELEDTDDMLNDCELEDTNNILNDCESEDANDILNNCDPEDADDALNNSELE
ncbi:15704_t:CDS:2, partial [Gigaspora rosea]